MRIATLLIIAIIVLATFTLLVGCAAEDVSIPLIPLPANMMPPPLCGEIEVVEEGAIP